MMKTPRRWILILSLLAAGAQAQSGIPVRIAEVSDTPQVVRVNEVLPERFVAQVSRTDNGAPVGGVEVMLEINYIMCLPMQPNCGAPPHSVYGRFESGPSIRLVTNAQGLVTAPPFSAGETAGSYSLYAMVPRNQPSGINIGPDPFELRAFRDRAGSAWQRCIGCSADPVDLGTPDAGCIVGPCHIRADAEAAQGLTRAPHRTACRQARHGCGCAQPRESGCP
jgi:hypothetical protein